MKTHRSTCLSSAPETLRVSGALLVVSLLWGLKAFAAEGYEIRADRMETIREGEEFRRTYSGDVKAELDSVSIRSERATVTGDEVLFSRRAEAVERSRKILADTLIFSLRGQTVVAAGAAVVSEADRWLRASRVTLSRSSARVQAMGRAEVCYPEQNLILWADSLEIGPAGAEGTARGEPRITRLGSDTLAMSAGLVRFADEGAILIGEGWVKVSIGRFAGRCDRAVCAPDSIRLEGSPVLRSLRYRPDGRDSSQVRAEWVRIGLEGGRAQRITASGGADVQQDSYDARGGLSSRSNLKGDTVQVDIREGEMSRAVSCGSSNSLHRGADSSGVDLKAETIEVLFKGGRVSQVEGKGKVRAFHSSGDDSEHTRLEGDRLLMALSGDHLESLLLEGAAICEYAPTGSAKGRRGWKNRLSGDRIRLAVRGGSLRTAAVEGGAVGSYWMTDEEREGR